MSSVTWHIGEDYQLNGVITSFEAYMFITTPKFIAEHPAIVPGEIVIVDGNRGVIVTPMDKQTERAKCLTKFNQLAKAKIPSMPKPTGLSCCLIDFSGSYDFSHPDYNAAYSDLKDAFIKYMTKTDRVAVMVQHWAQNNRWPHVHILYQRRRGEHNAFQDWLLDED